MSEGREPVSAATVRELAAALPGVEESPHFDRASFRVRGRIFATLAPDGQSLNVLLPGPEGDTTGDGAVAAAPGVVSPLFWGPRRAGVRVELGGVSPALLEQLLTAAWRLRVPKRVGARHTGAP